MNINYNIFFVFISNSDGRTNATNLLLKGYRTNLVQSTIIVLNKTEKEDSHMHAIDYTAHQLTLIIYC